MDEKKTRRESVDFYRSNMKNTVAHTNGKGAKESRNNQHTTFARSSLSSPTTALRNQSCIKFAGAYGHKMAKDSNTKAALANNTEPEEPTKSTSII
ncbi:hypothetical protein H5410_037749 [Solanum commersonii]|uniref:Uncharacterized protein n=1 Tax=Solanum commersonii TaxID=4109 RepID=A0A9J5Y8S0_SOLCO|nr:hypothetical protein H5410_037749 [Solanum commersonii]